MGSENLELNGEIWNGMGKFGQVFCDGVRQFGIGGGIWMEREAIFVMGILNGMTE